MPIDHPLRDVLTDIELAIRERLERGKFPARHFDLVDQSAAETIQCPGVNISLETFAFRRGSDTAWQMDCSVVITVIAENASGQEEKLRAGIYPMIIGVVALLATGEKLTRRIDGVDTPVPMTELRPGVGKKVYASSTRMAYAIPFTTTVTVAILDGSENAADLVAASLGFMQKPGDDTADVGAVIDLTGGD